MHAESSADISRVDVTRNHCLNHRWEDAFRRAARSGREVAHLSNGDICGEISVTTRHVQQGRLCYALPSGVTTPGAVFGVRGFSLLQRQTGL